MFYFPSKLSTAFVTFPSFYIIHLYKNVIINICAHAVFNKMNLWKLVLVEYTLLVSMKKKFSARHIK